MKAQKMFIYVKNVYSFITFLLFAAVSFSYAKKEYNNADFGKAFGSKAIEANLKLEKLQENFELCNKLCNSTSLFMRSLVFPEVMRYNSIKDGIESESLKTLYVQFGNEYANFSIGLFQMKPSFAELIETKAKQLLPDTICKELELSYNETDAETIRAKRVERLRDTDWQMVYLTAFICICNEIYKDKEFVPSQEKLQYYATVYNAGFDKSESYIRKKIEEAHFYLEQDMPGKKFKYAAIATWHFTNK